MEFGQAYKTSNTNAVSSEAKIRKEIPAGTTSFQLPQGLLYDYFVISSGVAQPVYVKFIYGLNTVFEDTNDVTPTEPYTASAAMYVPIAPTVATVEVRTTSRCVLNLFFKTL